MSDDEANIFGGSAHITESRVSTDYFAITERATKKQIIISRHKNGLHILRINTHT